MALCGCLTAWRRCACVCSIGVLTVVPDVEAKTVLVTGTAEPQVMLEALQKWGTASGKSVALA